MKSKLDEVRDAERRRLEDKGKFYDQFLNHSIFLNAGTASVLISLVSVFWNKDGNAAHFINIVLLISAFFFANNASKAVKSYFLRMKANSKPSTNQDSIEAQKLAEDSMSGFVWTIRGLVVVAGIVQVCLFDFSKEEIHS